MAAEGRTDSDGQPSGRARTGIECRGVTKTFGGIVAVDDLDIALRPGEITGLIGPNGAGKTTVFNVITGTLPPTAGRVTFDGTDITGWEPHRICKRGIVRTFQTPKPFRKLTVEENLRIARHFGRDGSNDEGLTLDSTLRLFDLHEKRTAASGDLSLMEQKYLDLGKALMTSPQFLLLDEMMAGLNPTEKNDMVAVIRNIHGDHDIDFCIIEHDVGMIRSISDRIVVIDEGRLLAVGTPDEVINDEAVREAYIT